MTLSPLAELSDAPLRPTAGGATARRFVAPIPACGPPTTSWSAWPEPESVDESVTGHPLLPLVLPEPAPAAPPVPAPPSAAPADAPQPGRGSLIDPGSSRHPVLPDASEWSAWLARMLIEVAYGRRPVGQLSRWAEDRVLATVVLRTRQLRLAAQARRPATLGSVRVQRPSPDAVEAMATIHHERPAAFAFRLEARGERWLCTAVDFGPQTPQPA